jgi:hypothetical protein
MPPAMTLDDLDDGLRARVLELGDERAAWCALRASELEQRGLVPASFYALMRELGWGAAGRGRVIRPDVSTEELRAFECLLDGLETAAGIGDEHAPKAVA